MGRADRLAARGRALSGPDDLLALWRERWPACPPLPNELKRAYPDRWVRFHSLPESRRHPVTVDEYRTVLYRYNTILDELFAGQEVHVVSADWSERPQPATRPVDHVRWHPDAEYWTSVCMDPDERDPEFVSYSHLYVSRIVWRTGAVDDLLRACADYSTGGAMIAGLSFERVHAPYDGGADVLLPTTDERDRLSNRYARWLSAHPKNL
jgi:hypothetical protein